MTAVLGWLKSGCTSEEELDELNRALDNASRIPHPWRNQKVKAIKAKPQASTDNGNRKTAYKRWTAPPGWTPPGWKSDAEAYARAKQAMGFINNPK